MERGERIGLGVAALGHLALLGLLSVGFLATPKPMKFESAPIEVSLSDDIGLTSAAPNPSTEAPAERLGEEPGPPQPDLAPLSEAPPEPTVAPQPEPKPAPAPDAKPEKPVKAEKAAAPSPSKTEAEKRVRPTGRLSGILNGLSDTASNSTSTAPPAATVGPQVRSALAAEVLRQIKPYWKPPSGADSEKLVTQVIVRLNRDGTLAGDPQVKQTGITDSNRAQAQLHRERALRAVQLAAPFKLPAEYYDAWKTIGPRLYEGL